MALRIEKISDRKTVPNKKAIKQVQAIFRAQFPDTPEDEIDSLPYTIFGGSKMGFVPRLYVARESATNEIVGILIYLYFKMYDFYYLDHIAVAPGMNGKGIGSELYAFLHNKAKRSGSVGIFFECLNDDPKEAQDENEHKQNIQRLKFYEQFGAYPIINNAYHEKVTPRGDSTLLMFDPLGKKEPLSRSHGRKIVKKILYKRYSDYCPPDYIKRVVLSFKDNPLKTRGPHYLPKKNAPKVLSPEPIIKDPISLKI